MGSESSPETLFEAVLEASASVEDSVGFVLFLTMDAAGFFLEKYSDSLRSSNIELCLTSDVISMDDQPLSAVRLKRDATLNVGIRGLRDKKLDAFVSAGNTGALIASATISLDLIKGCQRAALLASLPAKEASLAVVDVGGNLSCKTHHLVQQAHLGAAYQRCSSGIERPKVGLLNIGIESKKGTPEVREAYRILSEEASCPDAKFQFLGNIEGRAAFQGTVDVLVTDGFTGNVLIKISQGVSSFVFQYLEQEIDPVELASAKKHFSYEEYPGALVLGVDGIVIKCHGAATKQAMKQSLFGAITLVKNRLLDKIKEEFNDYVDK